MTNDIVRDFIRAIGSLPGRPRRVRGAQLTPAQMALIEWYRKWGNKEG